MDELQKLYDVLVREGKYTKSFDEFKGKWSSDTDYQNQVFDVVSRDGLYTKDKQSFFQKYSGAAPVFQEQQATTQPQVKKKKPTMASNLGATSSVSPKPADQYGQQFTQPVAEFQQEPTAPPVVLTTEGKKTYVAPKIKPFDIDLATKSLQKMNKDRANEYRKDPSVVTREEKEKAIQQANDGILTREESLSNIASNAITTIKLAVPKMNLVAEQGLEKLFGRELANKLVGGNIYTGNTMDEERTKTLGDIGDLMSQMKETIGITESIKKLSRLENGSASDLIVAAANSLSQIGTTAVEALGTGGISLYTDAVGGALYDYNEERAKQKGKTIEQLFQDGEADVAVPALFGSVSFYLDKIGLEGATKMISKKLTGSFMKKAALFGFETNKEGMTEWLQEGVDASNTTIGAGGSIKDATQAAVDAMFSERGLETYLQGSVGSAALAGGGRLVSKDNHNDYSKLTEENIKLLGDLQSGNISSDTKKMVLDMLSDNKSQLDNILSLDRKVIDKLSEEDKAKVADLYVELNSKRKLKNNGNISEVLRTKVVEDVAKLETEISNIINKVSPKKKVKTPVIKPALTPEETIRRDELQTAIDAEKNTTGIIVIGDESITKEEAVNQLQLLNQKEQDAIQEQATEVVIEEAKSKEEVAKKIFIDSENPEVEVEGTKQEVDNLFNNIKDSKFSSIDATFNDIVNNWDKYKDLDNDNIRTIKNFIDNPSETAIVIDNNNIEDGNHRLIASKIKGDKFIYTVPKSQNIFGDMNLIPKEITTTEQVSLRTQEEAKPKEEVVTTPFEELNRKDELNKTAKILNDLIKSDDESISNTGTGNLTPEERQTILEDLQSTNKYIAEEESKIKKEPINVGNKLVDEKGIPITLYHGTFTGKGKLPFTEFSLKDSPNFDVGFHFGTKNAAEQRVNDLIKFETDPEYSFMKRGRDVSTPRMISVNLNIKNPLRLEESDRMPSWKGYETVQKIFKGIEDGTLSDDAVKLFENDIDDFYSDNLKIKYDLEGNGKLTKQEEEFPFSDNADEQNRWIDAYLKSKGYDGIVYQNTVEDNGNDSYIVYDPKQIKITTEPQTTTSTEQTPTPTKTVEQEVAELNSMLQKDKPFKAQSQEIFDNVVKSVKTAFPDLFIQSFDTVQEMKDFAQREYGNTVSEVILGGEGGIIIYNRRNQPIAILTNFEGGDVTTMPHEAWHAILVRAFGDNQKLFTEFRDSVNNILRENGYGQIADDLEIFANNKEYIESGTQAEEWLVQLGGMLTASGIKSDSLNKKSKTLLTKLKDLINQFAERILGEPVFLSNATPADVLDFMIAISDRMSRGESIADFFEKQEFKKPTNEFKKPTNEFGKISKQIITANAKLSAIVRKYLEKAETMEKDGTSEIDIKIATGWERGADNKWRYEIPDGEIKDIDLEDLKDNYYDATSRKNLPSAKLSDIYVSPDLYEAYPEAANILVIFKDLPPSNYGSFNPYFKRITINKEKFIKDKAEMQLTLIHEIQHYVQEMDGLEQGSSPSIVKGEVKKRLDNLRGSIKALKINYDAAKKLNPDDKKFLKETKDLIDRATNAYKEFKKTTEFDSGKIIYDKGRISESEKVYDLYIRTAGEVEARNAALRSKLPMSERRNTLIRDTKNSVAPEDQVLFKDKEEVQGLKAKLQKNTDLTEKDIIKVGLANGFSNEAIRTVLQSRGFTEEQINTAFGTTKEAAKKVELTTEFAKGYNALKEKLKKEFGGYIKLIDDKDKGLKFIMTQLKKSDVYRNATDIQKEKMVRDIRAIAGKKEKSAPSVDKLFGNIKDITKITMTEKQAFAQQMKSENRGGKDAKRLWMQKSAQLTKDVKELADSGKVTAKQAAAVLRKFSGVNLFDDASIDRFVEYMSKVFENAEYAEKISNAFAKLPTAKRNVKTKLGIAGSLMPSLNRLLSIKPTLIPDAVLDSYLDIIDMIGAKAEVLTLEEINSLTKRVNDILNAVDTEVSKADELAERFNDYEDKVLDEDGKLDYAATIKAMLKDNKISEDEADIMRKYKSSIVPPVERVKKTEAELAVEKKQLIKAVESLDVDAENLPTRDERELAKELAKLIKTDAIKELTNNQLKNLFKTIDNINNGYLPHYAQLMTERLNAINNAKQLASGVQKASLLPFSKLYANLKAAILNIGKKRTSGVLEMIRRNPLSAIDQLLGNYKDNTVFKAMFEKSAEAEQKYKSAVSKVLQKLTEAQEKVAKSFNNDGNKTLLSSFKMMTYMVQLEHDSNIGSKQVNQSADYLKATIKHIDDGKSEFGERDATMLQSILDDYTNEEGQIDIDKLYKSFNNAEKNAIKTVREINESLTEKAVYTASIIRGDKINPLNNYVHLNVLTDTSPTDNLAGVSSMEQYNQSIMPSSKAKSLIERTGKVSPLNFDVFTSAMRGANFILMDYNLTEPIRTARKTINEAKALMEKDGRMPKNDRDLLNAISNAYEEVVSNILANNFIDSSVAEEALNFLTKQGYRAILASAPRFVAELSSNVSYALIAEPSAFTTGVGLRNFILSPSSVDVMNNLGSKETTRVYPEGTLSGRLVDTSLINQVSGIKGGKSKSDVENKARQIYNNSLKKYKNFVELTADALISTPDKMVMRPIWFGSFVNEFENITGKKPNLDKIAANDEAYMNENKEALDKARDVADEKAVRAGATDNAFMGILKGTVKPNQNGWVRAFNTFNSFMTKFMMYEYVTARTGINAAMGNGSISKKQGAALIAGVTSRMLVYGIMVQTLGSLMTSLVLGDDDEEDDKTFLQKVGQYFVSTVTGLIFGRDFGNATRSVVNFGLEKVNEKYLDALREGEYDPYQDAIQYSIIPNDPNKSQTNLGDMILKLGGSTGPALKTANLIIKKATEEPKKEAEAIERRDREIYQRIPLEVLGNAGFIPLYKDVRKILMADMYKSLRQSKGPTKKDAEKELLQGYDNRTDMKRYDPKLYEQTFGKGSPTYEVDKMIKDMEKQEKEMEQKIKDMTYGYTGETKKKK